MDLSEKIKKDIKDNKIMLYMKGTKEMPMCGFSSTVVNILNLHKVNLNPKNLYAPQKWRRQSCIILCFKARSKLLALCHLALVPQGKVAFVFDCP